MYFPTINKHSPIITTLKFLLMNVARHESKIPLGRHVGHNRLVQNRGHAGNEGHWERRPTRSDFLLEALPIVGFQGGVLIAGLGGCATWIVPCHVHVLQQAHHRGVADSLPKDDQAFFFSVLAISRFYQPGPKDHCKYDRKFGFRHPKRLPEWDNFGFTCSGDTFTQVNPWTQSSFYLQS